MIISNLDDFSNKTAMIRTSFPLKKMLDPYHTINRDITADIFISVNDFPHSKNKIHNTGA